MGILYNLGAILCVLALGTHTTLGQFGPQKPWPTYSLQNMPQTTFSCHNKILGGYYADPETQCQMFHVCVKVAGVGVQDFRFLCPNGTAFDQEAQICADWGDVGDCEQAVLYYGSDNFDLYRLGSGFESKRAPLAEEEEATFHLQRADTGDIRRSKETRVDQKLRPETHGYTKKYEITTKNTFYESNTENRKSNYDQNNDFNRVTQRFDAPKKTTSSYYTTPRGNDFNSNVDSKHDADDLFKGSHSSNFFSNRNGGREDEFYDHKPTTTSTTSTTPRTFSTPKQFYNGNGPQSDFNDLSSTKRPSRGRRPIPTARPSTSSITYPTTVPDIPKTTKRLTLQTSFNAGFNFGNDQFHKTTSSLSSSTSTTSAPFQKTSSNAQKLAYGTNDFVQATTYSPNNAFRYKTTTSKYSDINETALRGERPGQSTLLNSKYESDNLEIFSRESNRKSSNTERNILKQQAKESPQLVSRNEFTDFSKIKAPTGFQVPSKTPQVQSSPGNLGLNVQPLDPSKLNSELRGINQTQPPRGRVPISRFNDRQQTEPQYFRTRQETPAPFTAPQAQQQSDNSFRDLGRTKTNTRPANNFEPEQQKKQFDSSFNAYNSPQASKSRAELRTGGGFNAEALPEPQKLQATKPFVSNANSYASQQSTKARTELRTGEFSQQQQITNFNLSSAPQRENARNRPEQRRGSSQGTGAIPSRDFTSQSQPQQQQFDSNLNGFTNPQRDIARLKADSRSEIPTSSAAQQQAQYQYDSKYNAFNSAPISRTKPQPRTGVVSYANSPTRDSSLQKDFNRVGSDLTSTTDATTNNRRAGIHSYANSPTRDSSFQKDYNRIGSDLTSTTDATANSRRLAYANSPTRDSSVQKDFNRVGSDFTSTTDASTPPRGRGRINYKATTQHHGRSLDNYVPTTTSGNKKFSTLVPKDQYYPTTFKPTTYKKAFEEKPTKYIDPKSRVALNTTPLPSSTSQNPNVPDENDGQYHPELYEIDFSGNSVTPSKRPAEPTFTQQHTPTIHTTRSPQAHLQSQQQSAYQKQTPQSQNTFQPAQVPQNNFQQQQKYPVGSPADLSDEEELFKTAHSLNLGAASINKLRADTLKTADKTPQQSSPNFGFDRSSTTSTSTTTRRPTTSFIAATTTTAKPFSSSTKPKKSSSASKRPPHADADTSYDYAYYDSLSETPQEYSEYDVISEFRKTKNH